MRLTVFPNRCTPSKGGGGSYVTLTVAQQPGWPEARSFLKQFPPSTCSPGQHGHGRGVGGKSGLCGRCWKEWWEVWPEPRGLGEGSVLPTYPPSFLIAVPYLGRGPDYSMTIRNGPLAVFPERFRCRLL